MGQGVTCCRESHTNKLVQQYGVTPKEIAVLILHLNGLSITSQTALIIYTTAVVKAASADSSLYHRDRYVDVSKW